MKRLINSRLTALLLSLCLLLPLFACSSNRTPPPSAAVTDQQRLKCSEEIKQLGNELSGFVSSSAENVSDSDIIGSADSSSAAVLTRSFADYGELRAFVDGEKLSLMRSAAAVLLSEERSFCLELFGEECGEAINARADELSKSILSASDAEGLYLLTSDMANRLLDAYAVECTAENKSAMFVSPSFRTDENGSTWLVCYTNFALPGFEDSQFGYSLRLSLDGGKSELTFADSIYSHDNIRYDSGYCVCFNISSILKNSSVDGFFNGRNRVTFTLFALDNSFSASQEFYRLRRTDAQGSITNRQTALSEIIGNVL